MVHKLIPPKLDEIKILKNIHGYIHSSQLTVQPTFFWEDICDIIHALTLKLPGEGQMTLPLNLNAKNIPNADFLLVF